MAADRLKLPLNGGSFDLLVGQKDVGTCYTDYSGTSRTASCSREAMIEFAVRLLAKLQSAAVAAE